MTYFTRKFGLFWNGIQMGKTKQRHGDVLAAPYLRLAAYEYFFLNKMQNPSFKAARIFVLV